MNKNILFFLLFLILTPSALAAFTYDTKATYQTTSWSTANPGNLIYTAGSGSILMILSIQTAGAQRTAGTPMFNGQSFTNIGIDVISLSRGASELWYLVLKPSDIGSAYYVSVPNAATSRAMEPSAFRRRR